MSECHTYADHDWEMTPTRSTGENILGKVVTCWGWDLRCRKCDATSWKRNNEWSEEDEYSYQMSHY